MLQVVWDFWTRLYFYTPTISEHMTSRDITVNCEPKLQAVKLRRYIDFFPFQFLIKHGRWIFPLTFNNKINTKYFKTELWNFDWQGVDGDGEKNPHSTFQQSTSTECFPEPPRTSVDVKLKPAHWLQQSHHVFHRCVSAAGCDWGAWKIDQLGKGGWWHGHRETTWTGLK